MNAKISLPDLASTMSEDTGYDYETCEKFLKGLFATVADALIAGENVKIKGLGTFKSTEVDQRKSVNVNTGEEMLIPGHRKVSFTPDKSMAEAVNAPFSMFEPVELADDVSEEMLDMETTPSETPESALPEQTDNDEALPDNDYAQNDSPALTDSHEDSPEADTPAQNSVCEPEDSNEHTPINNTPINNNTPSPRPEPVKPELTQDSASSTTQPDTAPQTRTTTATAKPNEEKVTKVKIVGPVITQTETPHNYPRYTAEAHHASGRSLFRKGIFIGAVCAICIAAIFVAAWRIVLPDSFTNATSALIPHKSEETAQLRQQPTHNGLSSQTVDANKAPAATTAAADTTDLSAAEQNTLAASDNKEDQIKLPEVLSDADNTTAPSQTKEKYDKISKTRYLTTMAREYYGDYNLWPYIYDANKSLGHPDRIRPGTKIRIPSVQELGIDPKDPATIRKAKNRGIQIYKKYRNR